MAIQGSLGDIDLPTLVQLVLHDRIPVQIDIQRDGRRGQLYLEDGRLYHAALRQEGSKSDLIEGEEVIYELLTWPTGRFIVERDIVAAERTIEQAWDYLLVEGLRRVDEAQVSEDLIKEEASGSDDEIVSDALSALSQSDAAAIRQLAAQSQLEQKGESTMSSKSEQLRAILDQLVSNSADILGAVVVDNNGLLLAGVLNRDVDGNRIAAVTAGLVSLAGRSAQQLDQGQVTQTVIQAEKGNVIAMRATDRASFVALTSTNTNLGMAFLECRDAVDSIQSVL